MMQTSLNMIEIQILIFNFLKDDIIIQLESVQCWFIQLLGQNSSVMKWIQLKDKFGILHLKPTLCTKLTLCF